MSFDSDKALQLQMTLDRQLEFVKYLEGKGIALLTAATGLLAVAAAAYINSDYASLRLPLANVMLFSFFAILFVCVSFVPLDVRPRRYQGFSMPGGNIFFFGDVAKMTPAEVQAVLDGKPGEGSASNPILTMLADQIIVNGKICTHKATFVRVAIYMVIAALASPIMAGAIWLSMLAARERFKQTGEV